jgi:hypothetical protein
MQISYFHLTLINTAQRLSLTLASIRMTELKSSMGKYRNPIIAGFAVIALFIYLQEFSQLQGDGGRLIRGWLSIILRFFACIWIYQLAKSQNRKPLFYVLLGVLIPAITLIIVGIMGDKKEKPIANKDSSALK